MISVDGSRVPFHETTIRCGPAGTYERFKVPRDVSKVFRRNRTVHVPGVEITWSDPGPSWIVSTPPVLRLPWTAASPLGSIQTTREVDSYAGLLNGQLL